ncbi:alpha/beta fold hydrolase [uncultured Lactobacillus sp.]|uniref:alpha/beta fold hydrolase n=1 Tax=uncultured Lactobacillus sp. TaxID=153152 RepID=UPI00260F254D|nr:alpha/beta hydrolase [uncultured Lactobacillus sp.]
MYFETSDHLKLFYSDSQKGDKTILCVPGIGGSHVLWDQVVDLLKVNYRVIVSDPRNQGLSQRSSIGQTIMRHAQDVQELLEFLKLEKVIGVGNSMGAATLFAYQDKYGAGKFSKIIDLDQSPKMISDADWQYGFKDLNIVNFPEYLKLDFGKAHYAHLDHHMVAKAKKEYQEFPYNPEDNFIFLVDHARCDWRDTLRKLSIPLLILVGKNSPYFDYHFAHEVAKLNPLISYEIIPDCGHLIQAEQPEILAEEIKKFADEKL